MLLNKSRISYRIFITVASVIFTLFLFSSYVSYSLLNSLVSSHLNQSLNKTVDNIKWIVEKTATLSSRSYIRALAEQYLKNTEFLQLEAEEQGVSPEIMQGKAYALFSSRMIGRSGYTYIINSEGTLLHHPVKTLEGTRPGDDFINEQIVRKTGFLEYDWKNPKDKTARSKLLYMAYFQPWDWIISVSAYKDELPQLVNLNDFEDEILANKIGTKGYSFIIDMNGNLMVHPTLSGNIANVKGEESKRVLQEILTIGKGQLTYQWHDKEDGTPQKKIAAFETLEELGWIVVATGYVDDFYAPVEVLKKLLTAHLIVAFLLSIFISYYLSKFITDPLNRLLQQISSESSSLDLIHEERTDKNELEILSDFFRQYVDELKGKNKKLETLYAEQKKSAFDLTIYKNIFDNIAEGITITDKDGTIVKANPAFEKITGYTVKEAVGQNPRLLKSTRHPAKFYEKMWQDITQHGFWTGTIWNRRKNGEEYPEWLTISGVKDKDDNIIHYAAVFNDITEHVEQQSKIEFLAYHDPLTEIPNRSYIHQRFSEMLSESKRGGNNIVCIVYDLENFKTINDSLGQEFADEVLKSFVARLRPLVRLEDVFGRLGGDDFVMLAKTTDHPAQFAVSMIERIFEANLQPIEIGDKQVYITLNAGISHYPLDGDTAEELLKQANLALNNAEKTKGNSFSFFDTRMVEEVNQKIHYLAKIREGLQKNEFIPFYQPKINLRTGEVTGMEALARWQSDGRLLPPWQFIPVAEDSGLIIELSEQIYGKAFHDTATLIEQGYTLKLSVNLSPVQLQDVNFFEKFLEMQASSGLDAGCIEIEITESLLFENTKDITELLGKMVKAGFTISIDDFGTGYSSLQYLKHLPLDTLKIDMSFVRGIGKDRDDEQLVRTIILLAKQFGLHVVAEGIENSEQTAFLRELGCNDGQGFLFSRPLPFADLKTWIRQR